MYIRVFLTTLIVFSISSHRILEETVSSPEENGKPVELIRSEDDAKDQTKTEVYKCTLVSKKNEA